MDREAMTDIPDDLAEEAADLIGKELGPENIKRLQFREACTTGVILEDIATKVMELALSRLAAAPLPGEIADIVYKLRQWTNGDDNTLMEADTEKAAAALERMARENAHLEKVIAARDEQLTAEIKATGNFAAENERMAREIERLKERKEDLRQRCVRFAEERDNAMTQNSWNVVRIRELETEIAGLLKSRDGISDFRDAVMRERDDALARVAMLEAEVEAHKTARIEDLRRAGIDLEDRT